jgi:mannose-6-phosphate isomerase-like protein (cupin superfamily)
MLLPFGYLAFSAVLRLLLRGRRSEFAKDVELLVLRLSSLSSGGSSGDLRCPGRRDRTARAQGVGSPLHVHHREDEWFYVNEGALTFWVGGQLIDAPAGSFVYGPREIPHTFTVNGIPLRKSPSTRAVSP